MKLSITSSWKPAAACAKAWHAAKVAKVWSPAIKACYATGSLFHAVVLTPERKRDVFAEYPSFLTLSRASDGYVKGDPNAAARDIIRDAEYTRALPDVALWLEGATCEEEVMFTLGGIPWIAHIDLQNDGVIMDLKTCREIEGMEWNPIQKRRVPWHESLLYWHQLALYRRAKGGARAVALIACQSCSEPPPDVRIIELAEDQDELLDQYAVDIEASMQHDWFSPSTGARIPAFAEMLAMDHEQAQATLPGCGSCVWCRTSRTDLHYIHRIARDRGL